MAPRPTRGLHRSTTPAMTISVSTLVRPFAGARGGRCCPAIGGWWPPPERSNAFGKTRPPTAPLRPVRGEVECEAALREHTEPARRLSAEVPTVSAWLHSLSIAYLAFAAVPQRPRTMRRRAGPRIVRLGARGKLIHYSFDLLNKYVSMIHPFRALASARMRSISCTSSRSLPATRISSAVPT
jgi:hypothetical protein